MTEEKPVSASLADPVSIVCRFGNGDARKYRCEWDEFSAFVAKMCGRNQPSANRPSMFMTTQTESTATEFLHLLLTLRGDRARREAATAGPDP